MDLHRRPLTDPRDGRLIGVVDVSGPLETMHPATLAWVDSVAKLAEARLQELHLTSLERLRAVAAPVLARLPGRALVVDRDGWTAAVSRMPYANRITLPKSLSPGRRWLPPLGLCSVEPLAGGWLLRDSDEPVPPGATRIALDLTQPRRWSVTVSGSAGSWSHELSPRHAELLYLLAVHRAGRSAAGLAEDVFGDQGRTVTVRAEMSRVRRYLGAFWSTGRTASARTPRSRCCCRTSRAICCRIRRLRRWCVGGSRPICPDWRVSSAYLRRLSPQACPTAVASLYGPPHLLLWSTHGPMAAVGPPREV